MAPASAVRFAAHQLSISGSADLMMVYAKSVGRWRHGPRIHDLSTVTEPSPTSESRFASVIFYMHCVGPALTGPRRCSTARVAWLLEAKVLLPGISVLERAVAKVRTRANAQLHRLLIEAMTPEQRVRLDELVTVPDGARQSPLDRLRDGPYIQSGREISRALARLEEIRRLTNGLPQTDRLLPSKIVALARFAAAAKAQAVARLPDDRRAATLLAFIRTLEATAGDDVIDLFDAVTISMFAQADAASKEARLRSLRDLDAAALKLRDAGAIILDEETADGEVRKAVLNLIGRNAFVAAIERVGALAERRLAGSLKLGVVRGAGLTWTLQTNDRRPGWPAHSMNSAAW